MEVNLEKMDFKNILEYQKDYKESYNKKKEIIEYDFKIVSFKLGKEYFGIDIMNVKEIKKIRRNDITRVPNTLNFVKGVLNLRGEIISIIDCETMFHLEEEKTDDKTIDKNKILPIIVIKLDNLKLGLIVNEIQRVIPLRKKDIQPPSPLLGTINEKFIKGVAEINQRLYVIFDTDAIFSDKTTAKREVLQQVADFSEDYFIHFCNQLEELNSIHINDVNKLKIRNLYKEYIADKNIKELTSLDNVTAQKIMNNFYSNHNGEFWNQPYVNHFKDTVLNELKNICSEEVRVLIVGCGGGYEAFSVYFILQDFFEDSIIKMTAADSNLSTISKASGLECEKKEIPSWININKYFMKIDNNLYKIKKEINSKIYFEFHDARNISSYHKTFDLILARDLSIYFSNSEYENFIKEVTKQLIEGGVIIIGDNEQLGKSNGLSKINNKNLTLYKRIKG
ncbi:MAG: chemotaxis protein CheW [Spirochaetes bacterium]|nr:chemotaxis protein CheW [Spirochaetota bacterium]